MTQTYFRVQPGNIDPAYMLDTEQQVSRAWHSDSLDRSGISVCDSRETLAAYLATIGQGIPYGSGGWVLVQVEGELAEEQGLDAEYGEILIRPTRIAAVTDLDSDEAMWDMIAAAYEED